MLDQRRRRWADVVQLLHKCFVFAGMYAKHDYNILDHPIKLLLLWIKWVFKHQYLQMFGFKLNKYQ